MNHDQVAKDILEKIGGEENIQTVTHCATRLRITLKDHDMADKDAVQEMDDVISVVTQKGQFQVVIGNEVNKVYRSLMAQSDLNNAKTDGGDSGGGGDEPTEKRGFFASALDIIAGTFVPIVPALAGAGMIKALLTILSFVGWIDPAGTTYQILQIISDSTFYFLPIIIAHSASVKFNTNPYVSMAIGGVLLHPSFQGLVQAVQEGGPAIEFLSLPVRAVNYSSSVIPILLIIWFMSYVEPFVEKIVPSVLRIVVAPMLTFLIVAPVALVAIGPLGTYLGDYLALFIDWINGYASWIIPMLVGTFTPLIVMVGMHYALISMGINSLAVSGYEVVAGPGMLVSNIAQGGAVLAYSFKTKDPKMRSLSISTGISAVLGITEPALYGVELQNRRTLISAMAGGGIGGLYLGLMGVVRYVQVPPSIIGLTGYIGGEGMTNLIHAAIGSAIAFASAFIIQMILGEDPKAAERAEEIVEESAQEEITTEDATTTEEAPVAVSETLTTPQSIQAPMQGEIVPLDEVPDAVFSSGALGQGGAIKPADGKVYAPFDGVVTSLFPTKHAIGLTSDTGLELLIHCGLDTVSLEGEGFTAHVVQDDQVKQGDLLLEMDLDYVTAQELQTITPIIITNSADYQQIDLAEQGQINQQEEFIIVQ